MQIRRICVFGYGSLINPRSVGRTLQREIRRDEIARASLYDYLRIWDLVEWIHFDDDVELRTVPAVFLDLTYRPGATVNGVLIPLTEAELERMDSREKNYNRVRVTALVEPSVGPDNEVFTYIGKPEHTQPPAESWVPADYEALVLDGVESWGRTFEEQFHRSTLAHSFPKRSGRYVFTDAEQNRVTGRLNPDANS